MDKQLVNSWSKYVRNLDDVLEQLHQQTVIAVGITAYPRIIPAFFMDPENYLIYSVNDCADLDVIRKYANIYCLEEQEPKLAEKVQSTEYLMKNYSFHSFLKSHRSPYTLLLHTSTKPIVKYLNEQNIPWIGNDPKTFEPILHKKGFKELLVNLGVEYLKDWVIPTEEFYTKNLDELFNKWKKPVVVQAGDYEVGGGTHFIHNQEDLDKAIIFFKGAASEKVKLIKITPFIVGDAISMLGCVTKQGTLTSSLQLQLIDVPESLHGYPPSGQFYGHDWGYTTWSDDISKIAQKSVEKIGNWLSKRGYGGIFGVDFMYDPEQNKIYPLECNPRYTGAIPVYSEINLKAGVPPIDFFALTSYLKIPVKFDFEAVNQAWKMPIDAAHIAITPRGIETMKIPLSPGVYQYHEKEKSLEYLRPGAFLHELKSPEEFIIIDQVQRVGKTIRQNVPRLFKFIFNTTIAETSNRIKPQYGQILESMGDLLRR